MAIYKSSMFFFLCVLSFASCKKDPTHEKPDIPENPATFKEAASIRLGGEASAEIAAYDPLTRRLFVVNNEAAAKVDVLDLSKFPAVTKTQSLDFSAVSGAANSVAVHGGLLAIALEATDKQDNGKIAIYKTNTLSEVKQVIVGALPDMVTFSPDGKFIVSANEGEPNDAYTNDPAGSVSIINVSNDFAVRTLDFSSFESERAALIAKGFRVYGKGADLAKDVEPEYVAVTSNSRTAWVTLQENNAIAEVNLISGIIIRIVPLGSKDISGSQYAFDVSDRDGKIALSNWPIKAYYLPDAVSWFKSNGRAYLALANEGDTRAYSALDEEVRVEDLELDPVQFPNAPFLKQNNQLGRLTVTRFAGDTDDDGDYDELYATGARSLSIVDGATGELVADIGKDLEEKVIAAGKYDDGRSDNKGVEVEGVLVSSVNNQTLAFIGMERADMIAVYDVSDPFRPQFVQLFESGYAPEGILLIRAAESPNGRSLLVISCEGDGTVRFYQPEKM